jgi:bifunctional UDP-N-acetylglucosamine pyrophosphorylase/glucosamine-1-phosphate N-acetyltransferase
MWDPERTYVDAHVRLAPDVSLLPGVILRGRCVVGEGSEIGPNCLLTDTTVGQRATVSESICDRSTIGDGAEIGPFCVLRPGAEVPARHVVPPHTVIEAPEA